jgi:hypothetical protein
MFCVLLLLVVKISFVLGTPQTDAINALFADASDASLRTACLNQPDDATLCSSCGPTGAIACATDGSNNVVDLYDSDPFTL